MPHEAKARACPAPGTSPTAADHPVPHGALLEKLAFLLLLGVIALRPLVQESHTHEQMGVMSALGPELHTGPLPTLIFGAVILLAALLQAVASALRRGTVRLYAVDWALLATGALALASCLAAGNKRLAITAAADWALLLLMSALLFRLIRRPWQARLLLAVIVAGAACFAFECFMQRASEFDDTIQLYEQQREQLWRDRGIPLDAPEVTLFERRLYAREVSGFSAHSNVAGGYLVLCGFAAIGLAAAKLKGNPAEMRRASGVAALILALGVLAPVPLTGSKGALLAGAGGMLLAAAAVWVARRTTLSPRKSLRRAWLAFIMVAGATLGYGLYHGGLPGASMNFRWHYWANSAAMIADHPGLGVGMANFGRHYTQYKTVRDVEDISDPHNMLVRAAAEWGLPGAAAFLWLIVAGSAALVSPKAAEASLALPHRDWRRRPWSPWAVGLLLALAITCGRPAVGGFHSSAYFVVSGITPAIIWLIVFYILCLDGSNVGGMADDRPVALRLWLGAGLVAFLLHGLVSISFFAAGPATCCLALLAVGRFLAATDQTSAEPRVTRDPLLRPPARLLVPVVVLVIIAYVWVAVLPVAGSSLFLSAARHHPELAATDVGAGRQAWEQYLKAAAADRLDPAAPAELAAVLLSGACAFPETPRDRLDQAISAVYQAQCRDPHRALYLRREAQVYLARYAVSGEPADLGSAINATRSAIDLNPSRPEGYVELGDLLARRGRDEGSPQWLAEARRAYARALDLDAARPATERIRRLSDRRIMEIRQKMRACSAELEPGAANEDTP